MTTWYHRPGFPPYKIVPIRPDGMCARCTHVKEGERRTYRATYWLESEYEELTHVCGYCFRSLESYCRWEGLEFRGARLR